MHIIHGMDTKAIDGLKQFFVTILVEQIGNVRKDIASLELRVDTLDTKIDGVETRLNARIDEVEARLSARIDSVESKIEDISNGVIDVINSTHEVFEEQFHSHHLRLVKLESHVLV